MIRATAFSGAARVGFSRVASVPPGHRYCLPDRGSPRRTCMARDRGRDPAAPDRYRRVPVAFHRPPTRFANALAGSGAPGDDRSERRCTKPRRFGADALPLATSVCALTANRSGTSCLALEAPIVSSRLRTATASRHAAPATRSSTSTVYEEPRTAVAVAHPREIVASKQCFNGQRESRSRQRQPERIEIATPDVLMLALHQAAALQRLCDLAMHRRRISGRPLEACLLRHETGM